MAVRLVNYDDLDTWLSQQPNNTVDTPYELQILTPSSGSDIRTILQDHPNKYVDLRYTLLYKSTDYCNFKNCLTLIGAPKCESSSSKPQFEGCTNLKYVNHVSYDNLDDIFKGCTNLIDAGTIYNSRWNGTRDVYGTSMQSTFEGCVNLKSVIIEDSHNALQNISNAFKNCISLEESPELPSGITNMTGTFNGCINLEETPTIPNGVTDMSYTFASCYSLTVTPYIPNTVTNMQRCFTSCRGLVEVTNIPNSVTNMSYTFADCPSLEAPAPISSFVTTLNHTYYGCTNLEYKYIIPSTVTTSTDCYTNVPTTKWRGTSAQLDSWIPDQTSEFEGWEIEDLEPTGRIVYGVDISNLDIWLSEQAVNTADTPYEIKVLGLTSSNWTQIKDALTNNIYPKKFTDLSYTVLPSGITTIASGFENCALLVKAPQIPTSVLVMSSAFDSCISLVESPVIPNGVIGIQNCFKDCQSLIITPTIPSSVELMNNAFQDCKKITTPANIPSGVSDIRYLFSGCTSLQSAPSIPNGIRYMAYAFEGCISLREAPTLPQNVTDITGAFAYCSSLKIYTNAYYEIPANVTSMKDVFRNCSSLTDQMLNVILYLGTITNFDNTFEGCNKITTYKSISSSVTSAKECFKNCTSLVKIDELGIPLNTLRDNTHFQNMFQNCTSLVQIGHKFNNDQNWHVMSLNIGASTVSGKVYDKDGFPTTISSTSITKTTMTLPNLTDEIMFPPNSLSDADLETLIQNVISSKYTWWKRQAINPNQKTFVLYADNPNNVITNIAGGGGTDIKVYDTLAEAEADLANLSVGDIIGTEQGGDGAVDAVTSGDMRLVTSNAVAVELLNGSAWTKVNNFNDLIYKKVGNTVFLHLTSSGVKFPSSGGSLTINATSTAISLPSAIRPKYIINVALLDNTYDNVYHGRINTDGSIVAWDSAVRAVNQISSWQFDICYRID